MDIVVAPDAQGAAHEAASWVARQLRNACHAARCGDRGVQRWLDTRVDAGRARHHAGAVGRDDGLPGRRASRTRRRSGSQCWIARCAPLARAASTDDPSDAGAVTRPRRGRRFVRRTAAGPARCRAPRARRRRAHRVVAAGRSGDRLRRLGGDLRRVQGQGADDADRSLRQLRTPSNGAGDGVAEGADHRAMDVARPRPAGESRQSHRHARRSSTPRRQRACRTRIASVCPRWTSRRHLPGRRCSRPSVRLTCARCSPTIRTDRCATTCRPATWRSTTRST